MSIINNHHSKDMQNNSMRPYNGFKEDKALTYLDESDKTSQEECLKEVICELCRLFYGKGWMSGTGGSMSIKSGTTIYVTPSGVHKERLEADQIFEMNDEGEVTNRPSDTFLRQSQCTPLYMLVYKMCGAGAVIHSHSKHSMLATLTSNGDTFQDIAF